MPLKDCRDVPLSTENPAALAGYEQAATLFHGYFGDPLGAIEATLDDDPGFVMGHCLRAELLISTTEKAALPALRQSVEAAEALASGANARERMHIAAARAWLDGDLEEAARRWGAVTFDYPRDALALQIGHLADFFLGHAAMLRDRIARALPAWDESVPGWGYVLGMHAFGLEETGDYVRAEAAGRRAVELEPRDPWSVHAVTHVMEMQGRSADGIQWLTDTSPHWSEDNGFAYHNWWHLALFHLDRGDTAPALALYDDAVRPRPSTVNLEMIDAAALLWRLRLLGVDVGDRWEELADCWEPLIDDGFYAFNDVHAMLAMVATGRTAAAERLLAVMGRRATAGGSNAMMTREVGLPLCQALVAFGRGEWEAALDGLLAVRPVAQRFGGSHAQRDLIALTAVEAALRGGRIGAARSLAAERVDLKPFSAANRILVQRGLKLARQAADDSPGRSEPLAVA
jgi:tetratricopeptide (TPR) repeat protein